MDARLYLIIKIIFGLSVLFCLFFLWKPRIGLNYFIRRYKFGKRTWENIGVDIKNTSYNQWWWRLMGIDENMNILPNGEKRFRTYMAICLCICTGLLIWIWRI